MRIKAEGDLAAGKNLVDKYGLKIDTKLRGMHFFLEFYSSLIACGEVR